MHNTIHKFTVVYAYVYYNSFSIVGCLVQITSSISQLWLLLDYFNGLFRVHEETGFAPLSASGLEFWQAIDALCLMEMVFKRAFFTRARIDVHYFVKNKLDRVFY